MDKLQLYIYKSMRGFRCVRNINPSENVQRHIRDVRGALEILKYDYNEKYLFYLLSYVEEGTFFTILRTIPDQPLDHLATTIFIPSGLEIGVEELNNIVRRTTRMVSNSAVSAEELNELHELFSKEYEVEDNAPCTVESEGREYAYSLYGGATGRKLTDFFGDRIYQTEFIRYAGVVLVDASLGVEPVATDLTDTPLCETAVITPPAEVNNFTPYVYGRVFDRPFRVSLGESVEIVWRRNGFEDIRQTVEITAKEQTVEAGSFDDSHKTISASMFYISSQASKERITDAEIIVNGVEIKGEHSFSYDELKNATVIVRAKGCLPYQASLNLAATNQALIQLSEQRRIYRFELPVKSSELGAPVKFEIHTKRQLTESPLEGYSLTNEMREGAGRSNHLEYTGGAVGIPMRKVLLYIACSLVCGFILGWIIMGGKSTVAVENKSVNPPTEVEGGKVDDTPAPTPVVDQPITPNASNTGVADKPSAPQEASGNAIAYLEKNTRWTRTDLESYAELKGLFDDMNNYRLDRLHSHWGPKLAGSERMKKLAYHAGESLKKKKFSPEGKTYCTGNDQTISFQNYLNRIDP